MNEIICYGLETRQLFDDKAIAVLDLIQERCARVEIEVHRGRHMQWFVQVYKVGDESIPQGFYGSSVYEAAARIAKVLGIKAG